MRFLTILTVVGMLVWGGVPAIASTHAGINYLSTPPAACPQTITFIGQISTSDFGPFTTNAAAQYQWLSDDTTNPAKQYVSFPSGATNEYVYWQRTFTTSHTGWVSLQVWSPGIDRAQNFPFQIVCTNGAGSGAGPVQPSPEDCVSYDPTKVASVNKTGAWYLMDGQNSLQAFASEADALAGLAVARTHRQQCFVGRGKGAGYLMEYWK